ncbi:hypothetical protein CEN44_04640 [Fischerella muscicola CCMEE 5323]|uniref:Uncharacterized protein n=1 Tax=Fischerella muscicola CCMEE 5323 TaxID=2019572 RepID=A0A2N6K763_FISMU|nr:hypothetical protein CEN44_04640 [Fischerella muscicola CCMEE 5323]
MKKKAGGSPDEKILLPTMKVLFSPTTPRDATYYNCWNPQGRSGSFMPGKESTAVAPPHLYMPTPIFKR